MINFLKRHVWPWSEIERLRREKSLWQEKAYRQADLVLDSFALAAAYCKRLDKYEPVAGRIGNEEARSCQTR